MNILGIDYGRKKAGLAVADDISKLAEPYKQLRFETISELINKVSKAVKEKQIEKIVLGISEGEMAIEQKNFGEVLQKKLGIEVLFQDETLSTKEAQTKSIEAGIQRKRRIEMEDAYAASIILQSHLGSIK